ncbi:MAG: amidohydrolase family protein [Clostridium sp.]
MKSIRLKNGKIMDCSAGKMHQADIFIQNGKIMDATVCSENLAADEVEIDCRDCIITPGLIDLHLHLFFRGSELGVPADLALIPNGVTTGMDAGTSGIWNFESCLQANQNNVSGYYSLINVAPMGLISDDIKEDIDPALYDWTRISCLTEKYADRLKGLKIKMGKSSVGNLGIKPLKKAIQIAEMCGLPLVVHVTDPGVSIEAIAECLRPGDIFCHMYQGKGETILDKEGSIRKSIQDARERGVLFDACNGNGNFSISVAQKALKQKFFPDIISTDLTPNSWYQGYAVSMPELMSKYLALGLLLEQIIRCTTWNPAKFLGKERELGTLQAGTAGDVTVWKLEQQNRRYFDCTGDSVDGNAAVYPVMTIKSGMICWRAPGF